MRSLTFRIELAKDCHEETAALQRASWAETFEEIDGPMRLDMMQRLLEESRGKYVLVVARDDDGKPVGLCAFFIYWAKLKSAPYAMNDIIYMDPAYRVFGNAKRLWNAAVHELLRREVTDVRMMVPITAPDRFFRAMGMKPRSVSVGRIYTKEDVSHALETA